MYVAHTILSSRKSRGVPSVKRFNSCLIHVCSTFTRSHMFLHHSSSPHLRFSRFFFLSHSISRSPRYVQEISPRVSKCRNMIFKCNAQLKFCSDKAPLLRRLHRRLPMEARSLQPWKRDLPSNVFEHVELIPMLSSNLLILRELQ